MFRGFYTVASGMLAQQRKTEMLSNNMANANTPGFKADQSSMRAFPEMLLQRLDSAEVPTEKKVNIPFNSEIGTLNTGVYMQEATPNFLQGDLKETGNGTDVALTNLSMPVEEASGALGSIFFTIEGLDGTPRYTRNGNFTVDGSGFLTTANGQYVLDNNDERIQLPSDQFTINEEGQVLVDDRNVATLGIGFAGNPNTLVKQGDGLFASENNNPLPSAYNIDGVSFRTSQGFLERSNVDAARTMTDMMTAYRAFEANQKVLQAYDRSMEKAANEIGRVNG
jgi:flagellar basal-body rod protein FlgF